MIDECVKPDSAYICVGDGLAMEKPTHPGVRSTLIASYDVPRSLYQMLPQSPVKQMSNLGALLWYGLKVGRMQRRNRKEIPVNVDEVVARWHKALVQLCIAHSKDDADRAEADVEACLTPLLTAPIKQIREFIPKLRDTLKNDPTVPYLVWRAFEVWVKVALDKATDEGVKTLKTELAQEIADLVEEDAKNQLPEAIVRALQWRDPETLQEFKETVEKEKKAGRPVRMRGRESCLFLEAGGSEEEPKVCVQL